MPPLPPSTKSLLLIGLGDAPTIQAEPVASLAAPIRRSSEGLQELLLFAYPEELAALRIQPGEVQVASSQSCATSPLPTTETMFSLGLGDPSAGFIELSAPPPRVRDLRIEIRCPCVPLEETHRSLGAFGDGLLVTARPSGRLALIAERGVLEVSTSLELLASSTVADTLAGAYLAADGAIRATGKRGRLYRWSEGAGLQQIDSADPPTDLLAVGGSPPGFPDEALVTAEGGGLYALSAGALSLLPTAPSSGSTSQWSSVLWRGPGRFLVSLRSGEGLQEVTEANGTWVARTVPWESLVDPVVRLGEIEPYGVLLTTRTVRVFHRPSEDAEWVEIISTTPVTSSFHSMLAFRGGMLLGYSSVIVQHHPESGFCPPTTLTEALITDSLFEHEGAIYATGDLSGSELTPLYRFVPSAPSSMTGR